MRLEKSGSAIFAALLALAAASAWAGGFALAPTGQRACYDTGGREMRCTPRGGALGGQDAAEAKTPLRYRDNGDGTVSDLNTGLVWQKTPGPKTTFAEAQAAATSLRIGGQSGWRLPNIKELYSLMDFSGSTPRPGPPGMGAAGGKPYIDTAYFDFRYGDAAVGERIIDAQYWSATEYAGRTMGRDETVFGVNFADGRIKGYPKYEPRNRAQGHRMFVRYVRGPEYGRNDFADNGDGTVTDRATGLMWMKADSGELKAGPRADGTLDWAGALDWAARLNYAGHTDWRLPNAKELQSIVDYGRSPQTSGSAAIAPVFRATSIRDEGGNANWAHYWTSTSHLDGPRGAAAAVYVAFGEALGFMRMPPGPGGVLRLVDVHGAGAQRSDPKQGDPRDYPQGRGPQGDVVRIYNLVRLVRDAR